MPQRRPFRHAVCMSAGVQWCLVVLLLRVASSDTARVSELRTSRRCAARWSGAPARAPGKRPEL